MSKWFASAVSTDRGSRAFRLFADMLTLAFLGFLYAYCSLKYTDFLTRDWDTGHLRLFPFAFSLVPVLLGYVFCRLFLGSFVSGILIGTLMTSVSYASHMKYALTMQPISWNDVWNTANLSVIPGYLSSSQIAVVLVVFTACLVAAAIFDVVSGTSLYGRRRTMAAVSVGLTVVAIGCSSSATQGVVSSMNSLARRAGLEYLAHDWKQNLSRNGLSIHLIQTSVRKLPQSATHAEADKFRELSARPVASVSHVPRTVITILCEACWNGGSHFTEIFDPITKQGFTAFRGISPVYGGGTVNASYEMLTGLPSQASALSGIIYQEYSSLIAPDAMTVASQLRNRGYRTIAMHNHDRKFWQRDIVLPKLGFDSFVGLEDMKGKREGWWASDKILFDAALGELKRREGTPLFLSLATVYTHGGYVGDGLDGVETYRARLAQSMQQLAEFVGEVLKLDPQAAILIYGDHKPQLTHWFAANEILPKQVFDHIGTHAMDVSFAATASQDLIGDVPLYFLGSEDSARERFVALSQGKPFYCISGYLASEVLGSSTPAQKFGRSICDRYSNGAYAEAVKSFPDWLVSLSILGY